MDYCCEQMREMQEDVCYCPPIEQHLGPNENAMGFETGKWYLTTQLDFDSSGCDYEEIFYCPFCGSKLAGGSNE